MSCTSEKVRSPRCFDPSWRRAPITPAGHGCRRAVALGFAACEANAVASRGVREGFGEPLWPVGQTPGAVGPHVARAGDREPRDTRDPGEREDARSDEPVSSAGTHGRVLQARGPAASSASHGSDFMTRQVPIAGRGWTAEEMLARSPSSSHASPRDGC